MKNIYVKTLILSLLVIASCKAVKVPTTSSEPGNQVVDYRHSTDVKEKIFTRVDSVKIRPLNTWSRAAVIDSIQKELKKGFEKSKRLHNEAEQKALQTAKENDEFMSELSEDLKEHYGSFDTTMCVGNLKKEYNSSAGLYKGQIKKLSAISDTNNTIENSLRTVDREIQDLIFPDDTILVESQEDVDRELDRQSEVAQKQLFIQQRMSENDIELSTVQVNGDLFARQVKHQKLVYKLLGNKGCTFSFGSGKYEETDMRVVSNAALQNILTDLAKISERYSGAIDTTGMEIKLVILCFGFADEEGQKDDLKNSLERDHRSRLSGLRGLAYTKEANAIISERRAITSGNYILKLIKSNRLDYTFSPCVFGYGTKYPKNTIKYAPILKDPSRRIVQVFFHLVAKPKE